MMEKDAVILLLTISTLVSVLFNMRLTHKLDKINHYITTEFSKLYGKVVVDPVDLHEMEKVARNNVDKIRGYEKMIQEIEKYEQNEKQPDWTKNKPGAKEHSLIRRLKIIARLHYVYKEKGETDD